MAIAAILGTLLHTNIPRQQCFLNALIKKSDDVPIDSDEVRAVCRILFEALLKHCNNVPNAYFRTAEVIQGALGHLNRRNALGVSLIW